MRPLGNVMIINEKSIVFNDILVAYTNDIYGTLNV